MSDVAENSVTIAVAGVGKTFDRGVVRALEDVSFEVKRGEFVAITGPSGCGKSTLLHLLAALDRPTAGTITIDERALSDGDDLNEFRRRKIGLVFQLHNLLPNLDALENVEIAMFGTGTSRTERRERARKLLADVGLTARERSAPPKLSGGERQRVAIARALGNEPPILLADEPTGNLDSAAAEQVLGLLARLRSERNLTIVMVTHDPSVAAAADRVIHMRDGRIGPA